MNNDLTDLHPYLATLTSQYIDAYRVGALLYTPATNDFLYEKLLATTFGTQFSLAFCLEDAIDDSAVTAGEKNIIALLSQILKTRKQFSYLPNFFIRVRTAAQIGYLFDSLGDAAQLLNGFICPKFCLANAPAYLNAIIQINQSTTAPIYMLPILESGELLAPTARVDFLDQLHALLLPQKQHILNIRVGGNDLCHTLGVRRTMLQSIYDIRPIAAAFSDIIACFHQDFVISGAVWEYFNDPAQQWQTGLQAEIQLDLLNGFIGKTVIHPNQIAIVNQSLKVSPADYQDALAILDYQPTMLQVAKSADGARMNEIKTHTNWAKKQLLLAYLYGIL